MNSPFPGPQAVRIVTDSSCDLPAAIADELGITIVPLTIRFGDEEFIDREELTTAEFWSRCVNTSKLPETAAPAPGQFEMHYRRLAAEGATGIVVVSLSGALSATLQSAQLAARSVQADNPSAGNQSEGAGGLDIRVLDSRSITMGLGTIALACARLARTGASIDDVEATAVDLIERTRVFGALDTLENLKKGGRIGNAKALLATALSIKPIIEVTGGVVEQGGKQRTRSKALAYLVDKVKSYDGAIENLAVLHADCSDVDEFVQMLQPFTPDEIVVGEIGPVIGTHGGRGTIGVAFQVTGTDRSA
ncbi:MAG: DegV family protein [Ilumatobacteraceae bacterium]